MPHAIMLSRLQPLLTTWSSIFLFRSTFTCPLGTAPLFARPIYLHRDSCSFSMCLLHLSHLAMYHGEPILPSPRHLDPGPTACNCIPAHAGGHGILSKGPGPWSR